MLSLMRNSLIPPFSPVPSMASESAHFTLASSSDKILATLRDQKLQDLGAAPGLELMHQDLSLAYQSNVT